MKKSLLPYLLFLSVTFSQPYKIFISKKEKMLYVIDGKGKIVKKFEAGVGKKGYETPSGIYRIKNKIKNPAWSPSPNVRWLDKDEKEYLKKHQYFPYGHPKNPLRYYWIGLKKEDGENINIGIHGIVDDIGVGKASSHGCIRVRKNCLEFIVKNVSIGSKVIIDESIDTEKE